MARYPITRDWSIELEANLDRRIEDGRIVFWRPDRLAYLAVSAVETQNPREIVEEFRRRHPPAVQTFDRAGGHAYLVRVEDQWELNSVTSTPRSQLLASFYFGRREEADWAVAAWNSIEPGNAGVNASLEPLWFDREKIAYASRRALEPGRWVGWAFREEPDHDDDSGWRLYAGDEEQEFLDARSNFQFLTLDTIVAKDPALEKILGLPVGSAFERKAPGDVFAPVKVMA